MTIARCKLQGSVVLSTALFAGLLMPHHGFAQFSQQGPKLIGSPAAPYAAQGYSVDISADGTTAIVGGPYGGGGGWIWTRSGGVWTQQGPKLTGSGAVGAAYQGGSVSLSADGNTAIIGGPTDNGNAGAAWVWTRSGTIWSQQGPKLVGSGAIGAARQGFSVSLSADGTTAIVGGPDDDSLAGAAWIWTRNDGVWAQQGPKLVGSGAGGKAQQGWSVSISTDGNTAVVGGPGDHGTDGAAWVWTRSGRVWTQQGPKLVGSGAVNFAVGGALWTAQGRAVAISGDGNTVIVGGPGDGMGMWGGFGAAWIWRRRNGIWLQEGQKLVGSGVTIGPRVAPVQGSAVSLSDDGNTAAIGGPGDYTWVDYSNHAGAVWLWTWTGSSWTQRAVLKGSDAQLAQQGTSVSLAADGNTLIFGGPKDVDAGAAWVFAAADLAILITHSGRFLAGDTGSYAIIVTNSGGSPTSGTVTVTDTLPAGLTLIAPDQAVGGWTCSVAGLTVTCMRTDALAVAASYPPITLKVNVANDAPTVITNTATVAIAEELHTANNIATDVIQITRVVPAASVLVLLLLATTLAILGVMYGSPSRL